MNQASPETNSEKVQPIEEIVKPRIGFCRETHEHELYSRSCFLLGRNMSEQRRKWSISLQRYGP